MKKILMLLTNAYLPDPRPQIEAISLVHAGYGVKILCWDRGERMPEKELRGGIEIERIKLYSRHARGNLQVLFLMVLWIKMFFRVIRDRFDVIYCHDFDTLLLGLFIRIFKRKKLVFDSHEVYSRMLGKNVFSAIKLLVKKLEKIFVPRANLVFVTCEGVENLYRGYGVKKVFQIPNWKNINNFSVAEKDIQEGKRALGIGQELIICYIANLGQEKKIEPLLEVVAQDKGLFLLIGGDGVKRMAVEESARKFPNIKYLGFVPYEKVPFYTALSDIVYYGFEEKSEIAVFSCPNKLFEALAAGKALIGGNSEQMNNIIRGENCGVAIDNFNQESIKEAINLMKDRRLLEVFQRNSRKAALEKYNWGKIEGLFLAAIGELLNS